MAVPYCIWLAVKCAGCALFSIFLLIAYGLIFNTVQANRFSTRCFAFNCPEWLTGGALALLTLLTIVTGLKGLPA